jgi:hypothetical protein
MPAITTRGAASAKGFGWSGNTGGGQQAYTTAGTYSWVAPVGVTKVSVVTVGAGSGKGGGLGYKNNYAVTPGCSYAVVVGAGVGTNCTAGSSYFVSTAVVRGIGGGPSLGGGYTGDGGGTGGGNNGNCYSGGGAGGYAGNGGYAASNYQGTSGSGGAGGGAGVASGNGDGAGGGGGVGILGQGASGAGGTGTSTSCTAVSYTHLRAHETEL